MINDQEYWNQRFLSGDWTEKKGSEQTLFHYNVLIEYMPEWLKKEISNNKMSICDLGCGMGEGVNLLKKYFKESEVSGVDFSQYAIENAKKNYFDVSFICSDIKDFEKHYDVCISSHTLEHFKTPFNVLNNIINLADKYFILIIPFQEKELYKEHAQSFDYNFFPLNINDHELVHYKEIEKIFFKDGGYWDKEQILIIYANRNNIDLSNFSLEELNNKYFDELKSSRESFVDRVSSLEELNRDYVDRVSSLEELNNKYFDELKSSRESFVDRVSFLEELNRDYVDRVSSLEELNRDYVDRVSSLEELNRDYVDRVSSLEELNRDYVDRVSSLEELNRGYVDRVSSLEELNNKYINEMNSFSEKYENDTNELNIQLMYYQENEKCIQKKLTKRLSKIRSLEKESHNISKQLEILKKDSMDTKNQLEIIASTRPYRLAYLLRRFSHEFMNGNKKDFLKWIYCKLTKKKSGLEFRYNPLMELVKK